MDVTPELPAVHRSIEHHASFRGAAAAIVDGSRSVTYRELNLRGNAVARHLMAQGLRRGSQARVRMAPGADLAAVLLGVLKAGGFYVWESDGGSDAEPPRAIILTQGEPNGGGTTVDLSDVLAAPLRSSPNLPVLTRPSDVACAVPDPDGAAAVMVPHATMAVLRHPMPPSSTWSGVPGALDLWALLLSGGTAHLTGNSAPGVAA